MLPLEEFGIFPVLPQGDKSGYQGKYKRKFSFVSVRKRRKINILKYKQHDLFLSMCFLLGILFYQNQPGRGKHCIQTPSNASYGRWSPSSPLYHHINKAYRGLQLEDSI
jgi:hypothetical protein